MAFTYAGHYFDNFTDQSSGRPVLGGTSVLVYLRGTTTKATLYTSRTKGTTTANPTTLDSAGNLSVYVDPGDYDVVINGSTLQLPTIPRDPSEPVKAADLDPAVTAGGLGGLAAANNLSDVGSATTARSNLGLGSAATHATTDYDAAGAASTAQTAATSAAATDATTKANAAQAAAIAAAATDATTKASAVQALEITDVAATVTANGALTVGRHNPVDATSGNRTMTLASASAAGQMVSFEKVDSSANTVAVTLNLRGTPTSTVTLVWQYEDLLLKSKADGSWWPVAGHKTKASLDTAYGPAAAAAAAPVQSVATRTGAVVLTSSDVGLGNVNNTADTAKPVSTAQQTALNLKLDTATATSTYAPLAIGVNGATTRLRAVAIGDSTIAGLLADTAGTTVLVGATLNTMGSVGVERAGPNSWFTHACLQSNGRLLLVHNAGVGNDTTTGMLARFQTDVVANSPDVVFLGNAHNDFIAGSGITLTQTRANIAAMVLAARQAGIMPILVTNYPENSGTYAPTIRLHNAWLKQYAAVNHLIAVDPYSAVVDTTSTAGAWIASYTIDGTHASPAGASVAGAKVLADLGGILHGNATGWGPWVPTDRVSPNLLVNPLFLDDINTDGIADTWTKSGTSTFSIVTDPAIIGKAQQAVITSSTSGIKQDVSVNGTTVRVGDRVKWAGVFKVTAAAGSLNWDLRLSFPGIATYEVHPINQLVGVDYPWASVEVEAIIPASATLVRVGIYSYAGTGTLWLAQQGLYNMSLI